MRRTKNKKNGFSHSKLLAVAKHMPPLYHKLPGEVFDIEKSEVVKWLVQQPEILNYIFNQIKGKNPYIVYNSTTGKWRGIDYVKQNGSFSNCNVCNDHMVEERD